MDVTDEKSSLVQTRAIPLYKSRSASHIYSLRGRWVNNCIGVRGEDYSYFIDIHDILRMEKLTDHVANPQFIARFKRCASETAMFQQKWFNTMAVEYPVPGAGRVAILWMNLGRIHVSAHTIHHRGNILRSTWRLQNLVCTYHLPLFCWYCCDESSAIFGERCHLQENPPKKSSEGMIRRKGSLSQIHQQWATWWWPLTMTMWTSQVSKNVNVLFLFGSPISGFVYIAYIPRIVIVKLISWYFAVLFPTHRNAFQTNKIRHDMAKVGTSAVGQFYHIHAKQWDVITQPSWIQRLRLTVVEVDKYCIPWKTMDSITWPWQLNLARKIGSS